MTPDLIQSDKHKLNDAYELFQKEHVINNCKSRMTDKALYNYIKSTYRKA
jgi:hypothetical protein